MLQANLDYVVRPCLKGRKGEEGEERRKTQRKQVCIDQRKAVYVCRCLLYPLMHAL